MKKYFLIIILFAVAGILPQGIFAATMSLEGPSEVGTSGNIMLDVKISTEKPLNTISGAISIPSNFEVIETSDGNSIVNFWIQSPTFDPKTRLLSFSGITPSGFSGKNLILLRVVLHPQSAGPAGAYFEREKTEVFTNGPYGEKDALEFSNFSTTIIQGKVNKEILDADVLPPEEFTPVISRKKGMLEEKWFVVFSTQDPESGVSGYEVAESRNPQISEENLRWKAATSPYVLKDQSLHSFIYMRARDYHGNVRVEKIDPLNGIVWYENPRTQVIIIFSIILFYLLYVWKRPKK